MILHPLFHWSPTDRRAAIQRRGLRIGSRPTCNSTAYEHVSLCDSPSQAWAVSAAVFGARGQEWDCWQVTLDVGDEVHPCPFWGNRVDEVRVHNHIPRGRLWLVGSRTVPRRGQRW